MRLFDCLVFFCFALSGFRALAGVSEAFFVTPMEMAMKPEAGASAKLTVVNKGDQPLKIRVACFERSDDINGNESRKLTKSLTVESSDFTLETGATKTLIVAYVASSNISREKAYRIVVRQAESKPDSSLDLRFVYVTSVYVTPANAAAKLSIENIRRHQDVLEFEVRNSGSAHAKPASIAAFVQQAKGQKKLGVSNEILNSVFRQNLLAGSSRKFHLTNQASKKSP